MSEVQSGRAKGMWLSNSILDILNSKSYTPSNLGNTTLTCEVTHPRTLIKVIDSVSGEIVKEYYE